MEMNEKVVFWRRNDMNWRKWLFLVGTLFLGFWLCSMPVCAAENAEPPRPNVLFILADDMGWRDSAVYGSTFYETPNVDRLARRGMRFTSAYAANPLCSPTRASILTGQYPGRLRFTTPAGHLPQEVLDPGIPESAPPTQKAVTPATRTRLPNSYLTYAERMKELGYVTGFFGKWHLGRDPYLPEAQGFDFVVGGREHPGPPGGYFAPWPCPTIPPKPAGTHICDTLTDEAIAFLQEHRDKPFLMNLWFYDVHAPFEAKERLTETFREKVDPDNPQRCPTMAAMLKVMDQNLGRVLDTLDRLELTEKTLIIFTSDNGGNMYNRVDGTTPTNNHPLRGGKATIYEGGHRVPLIVSWPGHVAPDTVNETEPVTSIDYYPTLLDILGLEPAPGQILDGKSILPILEGGKSIDREAIFCHFPHYVPATGNLPSTSVRKGEWKLIRFYADGEDQEDRYELYHLTDDLGENRNLAKELPEKVRELDALIDEHLARTDPLVPFPNPEYRKSYDGWSGNRHARLEIEEGRLVIHSTGGDPFLTSDNFPPVVGPQRVILTMKSDSDQPGRLFWSTRSKPGFIPGRFVPFEVRHDDRWHTYEVTLEAQEPIVALRIDPSAAPGTIRIDRVEIKNKNDKTEKIWTFGRDRRPQ
jgi:arylsulfatase A-like enzyme